MVMFDNDEIQPTGPSRLIDHAASTFFAAYRLRRMAGESCREPPNFWHFAALRLQRCRFVFPPRLFYIIATSGLPAIHFPAYFRYRRLAYEGGATAHTPAVDVTTCCHKRVPRF